MVFAWAGRQGSAHRAACQVKRRAPARLRGEPSWCHLDGWGYETVSSEGGRICINPGSEDCGQVGTLACDREGRPFCYYGVSSASRLGTACIACGSIGEACCTGTDYVCDTGSCKGGICRLDPPKPADPAKAIQKAIIACEFDKARQGLAALKSGDPNKDILTRWLEDAEAIEDQVDDLVAAALAAAEKARDLAAKGDLMRATYEYAGAQGNLERARDMTRCPGRAERLDADALSAFVAVDQFLEAAIVDGFARDLVACNFKDAAVSVDWAEENGFDSAVKMRQRLEEARTAERQAKEAFAEGQAANTRGNNLMKSGDAAGALVAYQEARTLFERARQLTECEVRHDAIAVAITDVGANENAASKAANKAASAGSGGLATAGSANPMPAGKHPCLDSSIPFDASLTSYSQYLGGGNTRIWLKGQYICGKVHQGTSFEIFDGSTITGYQCDQEGDRYVNCEVSGVYTITDVVNVDNNAVDYHYKCGPNWCWIHVMPQSD